MASDPTSTQPQAKASLVPPLPAAPTVHEAELASDLSGAVYWAAEIVFSAAVARRSAGDNVVVRGDDLKANRALAQRIEAAVGPYKRCVPHRAAAGVHALPHFQQVDPSHRGHCFYETPQRHARKKP